MRLAQGGGFGRPPLTAQGVTMSDGLSPFEQGALAQRVEAISTTLTEIKEAYREQGLQLAEVSRSLSLVTAEIATGKKAAWVFFAAVGAIIMKVGELVLGALPNFGKH